MLNPGGGARAKFKSLRLDKPESRYQYHDAARADIVPVTCWLRDSESAGRVKVMVAGGPKARLSRFTARLRDIGRSRWRPLPGSVTASVGAMTVTANAGASSSTASDRAPRLGPGVIQVPLAAFCTTGRLCGHCPPPRPPPGQSVICPGQTRSAEQRDHLHHWIILDWTC